MMPEKDGPLDTGDEDDARWIPHVISSVLQLGKHTYLG